MLVLSLKGAEVVCGGVVQKIQLNAWLQIIKRLYSICQLPSLNWVRGAMWKKTKVMFTFKTGWVYSSGLINVLSPFPSSFFHFFLMYFYFLHCFSQSLLAIFFSASFVGTLLQFSFCYRHQTLINGLGDVFVYIAGAIQSVFQGNGK